MHWNTKALKVPVMFFVKTAEGRSGDLPDQESRLTHTVPLFADPLRVHPKGPAVSEGAVTEYESAESAGEKNVAKVWPTMPLQAVADSPSNAADAFAGENDTV